MHRYLVTGTDTDVGKTRVTATLARALRLADERTTVVKLVQTGLAPGVPGDAARAGTLAGTRFVELARFAKPADPWSAALAQGAAGVHAYELVDALNSIPGAVVAEGAGGLMVPLNPNEHFGHVAAKAKLEVVLAVGLRSGCLNHALLTHNLCEQFGLRMAGAVLVERWGPSEPGYAREVERALQGKLKILGILPFAADEAASVESGASLFDQLVHAD
jgi:dethiobiotin synthetase